MFVQVIQAKTDDPAGLRRQIDRWQKELKSGAKGYLGSTLGVTAEGDVIGIARFESADAATANSNRPEQGEWWAQTEKLLSGPATFRDSSDVETILAGGSDDAGFVQVMQGRITDREALRKLEATAMKDIEQQRPDLIGSVRVHHDGGEYTEVAYFTSEAEARKGEAKGMPEEARASFAEWEKLSSVDRWLDLTDPWLFSP